MGELVKRGKGRPKGSPPKLNLRYRVSKLADYRRIIDYCLKCGVEGTMSQRQVEAMIRGAKSGAEVFVAEQYMRQIGLDTIEELDGPGPEPAAIQAREEIMAIPEIRGEDIEDLEVIEPGETVEDLW